MKTEEILNVEFLESKTEIVQIKVKSELVIAKESLTKGIEQDVRSVSSYFKELRKRPEQLKTFLSEAQKKGRKFDSAKIHTIINTGDLKTLTDADMEICNQRNSTPKNWSANRLFVAFLRATEIKAVKS